MAKWEQEVAMFEMKHAPKKLDDDAKMLALKQLMPKGLFGDEGVFRGKRYASFCTLRAAVLDYIEDRTIPTTSTPI